MAPPDSVVPVQFIVEAVRQRVAETSLRKTAAEVGMSPNGLRGVLNGTLPHKHSLKKLTNWLRNRDAATSIPGEVAEAALAVLVCELPRDRRAHAEADLRGRLAEHFKKARVEGPGWLK